MAVRSSALCAGRILSPGRFLLEAQWTQDHDGAGRITSIEKSNGLIGNQTRDLLACSIVPQPTSYNNKMEHSSYVRLTNMRCQVDTSVIMNINAMWDAVSRPLQA
jgi:hypothetical protein